MLQKVKNQTNQTTSTARNQTRHCPNYGLLFNPFLHKNRYLIDTKVKANFIPPFTHYPSSKNMFIYSSVHGKSLTFPSPKNGKNIVGVT